MQARPIPANGFRVHGTSTPARRGGGTVASVVLGAIAAVSLTLALGGSQVERAHGSPTIALRPLPGPAPVANDR